MSENPSCTTAWKWSCATVFAVACFCFLKKIPVFQPILVNSATVPWPLRTATAQVQMIWGQIVCSASECKGCNDVQWIFHRDGCLSTEANLLAKQALQDSSQSVNSHLTWDRLNSGCECCPALHTKCHSSILGLISWLAILLYQGRSTGFPPPPTASLPLVANGCSAHNLVLQMWGPKGNREGFLSVWQKVRRWKLGMVWFVAAAFLLPTGSYSLWHNWNPSRTVYRHPASLRFPDAQNKALMSNCKSSSFKHLSVWFCLAFEHDVC